MDELHAQEQEPEAEDRLPHVTHGPVASDVEDPPDEDDERRQLEQVEGEKLHGDGRADVRSEDHPDRLPKREQAGGGEPHQHHGRRARGLQHRRDTRPDEEALQAVTGKRGEDVTKARARRPLQAVSHEAHSVQKERGAAEQGKQDEVRVAHVRASIGFSARLR